MQNEVKKQAKFKFKYLLAIVVLLAVAVVVFIYGNKYLQEQAYIKQQLALLNQKQQAVNDLEDKYETVEKDLQMLMEKSPSGPAEQAQNISQIKDAYFLTRIADDRLQYDSDVQTAKQLLELALDKLANINTPGAIKAREIITADRKKLDAASFPDINSIQDKVSSIDKLINTLPARTTQQSEGAQPYQPKEPVQNASINQKWKQSISNVIDDLKGIVKVRKKTEIDPAMAYINDQINRAQFKLLLEQIRWAIHYRDAAVYQRSIKSAQDLLSVTFDQNNDDVKKVAATLNDLAMIKIQPDVPNLQDAVKALQGLLVG